MNIRFLDICDLIICWDRLTLHFHVLGHDEFGRLIKYLVPVTPFNNTKYYYTSSIQNLLFQELVRKQKLIPGQNSVRKL